MTITEVRLSPDLKHATCFVEPLLGVDAPEVVAGLNRVSKFLRGRLGHAIDMKFTPDLKFLHDESFEEAARMARLLDDPRVRRDTATDDSLPDSGKWVGESGQALWPGVDPGGGQGALAVQGAEGRPCRNA